MPCARVKLYDSEITVDDQIENADDWMMPIRPEGQDEAENGFTPMSVNPDLAREIKDSFVDDQSQPARDRLLGP